jgi:hypothetical protein
VRNVPLAERWQGFLAGVYSMAMPVDGIGTKGQVGIGLPVTVLLVCGHALEVEFATYAWHRHGQLCRSRLWL